MKRVLSAGIVVVWEQKILLVHPTNASWWGTYSIPKGIVEKHETPLHAAIRECYEETGVTIDEKQIVGCVGEIQYKNRNRSVLCYLAYLDEKPKVELFATDEVDWAGFLTMAQAEKRILPSFKPLLSYIKV